MLEVVTSTLKRGDEVRLVGFGNFSVTRRKASIGRNPRTGEPIQIRPRRSPIPRRQSPQGRRSITGQAAAAAYMRTSAGGMGA